MAIFTISGTGVTIPTPNRGSFVAEVVTVATAGTPVNPASATVPDGFPVSIKADSSNKSKDIYIADSAVNVALAAKRIVLHAGDAMAIYITDPSLLFIDASANGAKVTVMYEI